MRNDMKVYQYSFIKLFNELWFVFVFAILVFWGIYKIGFKDFEALYLVMIIPVLMMVFIPLAACFIVLSTKLFISKDKIEKKTFWGTRKIRWEDTISIEKKHFYVMLPDLEKPVDIEIRGKNKTVIRIYRFLKEFEEAEAVIRHHALNPAGNLKANIERMDHKSEGL